MRGNETGESGEFEGEERAEGERVREEEKVGSVSRARRTILIGEKTVRKSPSAGANILRKDRLVEKERERRRTKSVIADGRGNSIEEEREGKVERKVDEKEGKIEEEETSRKKSDDPSVMHKFRETENEW